MKTYKFRDFKVYASTEWLADNKKKYRQVFDRYETDYVYAELSFYNKNFDIDDWEINVEFRCYSVKRKRTEICTLPFVRKVSKYDPIGYIREGWGNKEKGLFWKKGSYQWEAWIEGEKAATKLFYIEDAGRPLSKSDNPYIEITSLRMYEGPYDDIPEAERVYLKQFDGEETRYVYAEAKFNNLIRNKQWQFEVFLKFYNDARELKGQVIRLHKVEKNDEGAIITAGWGSNVKGSWRKDKYSVEVIYMDTLLASKTFHVGSALLEDHDFDFDLAHKKESDRSSPHIKLFQIPLDLRTAFQQYLLFFKDYVRESKGKEILYQVNQVTEGLEIQIEADSEDSFFDLKTYFDEYLDFARKSFVGVINVEGDPQPQQIDLLRMRLEQQVNNLNMEIKYKDLQICMLEDKIKETVHEKDRLLATIEKAVVSRIDSRIEEIQSNTIQIVSLPAQLRRDCKELIKVDKIDEVFKLLQEHENDVKSLEINDIINLQYQWNSLNKERRLNQISFDLAKQHKSFIVHSILSIIDKI